MIKVLSSTFEEGQAGRGEIYIKIGDIEIKYNNNSFSKVNYGVYLINQDSQWNIANLCIFIII